MPSKRTLLDDARLYLILDAQVAAYQRLFEVAKKAIAAGVDIIQLRDKYGSAKDILDFSRRLLSLAAGRVPLIINDRVDLAIAGHVSGVHLGQDDMPITLARKIMGSRHIIGISCQTLAQAKRAEKDGADYVGFGSVFKTLTKPGRRTMDLRLLRSVGEKIRIPVFAIGGIHLENVCRLAEIDVSRIAVCRAICLAGNIQRVVTQLKANRGQ